MLWIYEAETQSYNLCSWCGGRNYCSMVTGKCIIFETDETEQFLKETE